MTWLQFFFWLSCLYLTYYLLNILLDWSRGQTPVKGTEIQELTFSEQQIPEQINLKPVSRSAAAAPVAPPATGLSGVTMTGLFELARTESIHLTRSVAF